MRVHQQNDDHQELWSVPPLEDLEDDENDTPLADVSFPINIDSDRQDARSSRNGLKRKLINQAKLPSGCKKFTVNANDMQKEAMRKEKEVEREKHSTILFDDVVKVVNPIGSSEYLKEIGSVIEGAIKKAFSSHAKQITVLTTEIENLKLVITQRSNQHLSEFLSTEDFAEKHNIHLPFESLETFQDFDAQLKEDKEFQKATKLNMWTSVDFKIPVAHSLRNVMKKYLSRNVIRQYTAVKETGTKLVFKKTALSSCIQDIIAGEYKKNPNRSPVTDKNFNQAIGAVINNSEDWEGHRSHPSKSAKADNEQAVDCAKNRQ